MVSEHLLISINARSRFKIPRIGKASGDRKSMQSLHRRRCLNFGCLLSEPLISLLLYLPCLWKHNKMSKLNCTDFNGYSSPVPIIGLYIAGASLVCLLLILWDVFSAIKRKARYIPCRRFSLNSVMLTLLAIVAKLPVDLTTDMPSAQDQLSKLTCVAMTYICIGFLAPSIASSKESESVSNLASLSIFVVTVAVNICIQTIVAKLPVDLTTHMPSARDQLSKLSGMAMSCICVGSMAPSFASNEESENVSNIASLSIFVVTVAVNICIQLGTGQLNKFFSIGLAKFSEIEDQCRAYTAAIVAKLPVDLTTNMPSAQDQLSKLSGTAMTCICIGFMAPSIASSKESESVSNMASLSIFVVTVAVNICIQLGT
ncbi:hypothetical protein Syun_005828 [Stephania yunnanensis]|uniref:Uncharacterized protein n=1 Tax=Stephania yunnanensis TaxID=152371 RepID=A0AAP0PX00_9MAGN